MPRKNRFRRLLLFLGGLLGAYIGACFWLSSIYLSPGGAVPAAPDFVEAARLPSGNPIWQTSGIADQRPSETVFVFAHGYGGAIDHWAPVIEDLRESGFDSIAISMPGHGDNPDRQVGFGPKEARLIAEAVDVAAASGAEKIIVVGVSMGGAAAWLATELNPEIDAIATEGAYARFDEAMEHWTSQGGFLLQPVVWLSRLRSGIDPSTIVPLDAALKWQKPALVIHAGDDTLIQQSHAQRLADASRGKLEIVPGASHASCYAVLGDHYAEKLIELSRSVPDSK